jgi:hypothetical protein
MNRRLALRTVTGGILLARSRITSAQYGPSLVGDLCASVDRISISTPTQKGKFYESILAKWKFLADALDPQEAALVGGKDSAKKWIYQIADGLLAVASIRSSREGVRIDAFSNGRCGPAEAIGFALIVNSDGALARPDMRIEIYDNQPGLPSSSLAAQSVVLIHELIHERTTDRVIPGFDDLDLLHGTDASRANNRFVYGRFSKTIKAMESYK